MSKLLKLTTMLILGAIPLVSSANYRINIPLEITQGGALPNGSIVMGNGNNPDNGTPPPASTNCMFDANNLVVVFKRNNSVYKAGDEMYGYNQTIIGYNIPSRGFSTPIGLSKGVLQDDSDIDTALYEICSDNFSGYSTLPPLSGPPPGPEEPPEDTNGPDYTPECLPLDTTNNYAAYDRVADQYEYHSTTYGINHVRVNWVYKPADYDEDRPGSYQYLPEVNDSVSGPNPNYDYNAICRVKKRLE